MLDSFEEMFYSLATRADPLLKRRREMSWIIDYDTEFSKDCCWLRVKANSKEEALQLFWIIVPACTQTRKVTKEY